MANNASRPSLSTESDSVYYTDSSTVGSRTPRQSYDGGHREDTDAESQLYQDARSFANSSVPSLAIPMQYTPTPGAETSSTGFQQHLTLPEPSRNRVASPTGAAAAVSSRGQQPSAVASQTPLPMPASGNTGAHAGHPSASSKPSSIPHQNDLVSDQQGDQSTTAIASGSIDAATRQAYEEGPDRGMTASSTIRPLAVAQETAAAVNRQAASQAPLPQPATESVTQPSVTDRAATEAAARGEEDLSQQSPEAQQLLHQPGTTGGGHAGDTITASHLATDASPTDPTPGSLTVDSSSTSSDDRTTGANGQQLKEKEMTGKSGDSVYSNKAGSVPLTKSEKEIQKELKAEKKEAKKKNKKKGKGADDGDDAEGKKDEYVNPEDNPDLAHFTPEQKKIIIDQVDMGHGGRKATYLDLYKFSTKYELLLDFIGIICAIASGVVQPLMTVVFGNLTTAFVRFGNELLSGNNSQNARSELFREVNKDALYLVYIGIGMFCTTYSKCTMRSSDVATRLRWLSQCNADLDRVPLPSILHLVLRASY